MDLCDAGEDCSIYRIEWRRVIYHARCADRHFDHQFHTRRGVWFLLFRRSRVVVGCAISAYFERGADGSESWSQYLRSAAGIWEIFREEVTSVVVPRVRVACVVTGYAPSQERSSSSLQCSVAARKGGDLPGFSTASAAGAGRDGGSMGTG